MPEGFQVAGRTAVSPDVINMLARFLLGFAPGESVRTLEALAATVVNAAATVVGNSVRAMTRSRDQHFTDALTDLLEAFGPLPKAPQSDHLVFAACSRIAKRAVTGALRDQTHGATRFHALGCNPQWARGLNPCAWIGSFLFYLPEETFFAWNRPEDSARSRVESRLR